MVCFSNLLAILFLNMFSHLIETDENYKNRIIRHYKMFKSKLKGESMTVKDILLRITYFPGYFPEIELTEAIKNKEEITPHLLCSLEKARDEYEDLDEEYWLHIPAIYLLAEFREKKAFPLIVDLLKLSHNDLESLFGDVDMGNFLASTYNGNFSLLEEIIEDEKVDEFSRWEALKALVTLEKEGILTREFILNYLKKLFECRLSREDHSVIWIALITTCFDLKATDLGGQALKAFDEGLVEEEFGVSRDEIVDNLIHGKDTFDSSDFYYIIKSTIDEMKDWPCFKEEPRELDFKGDKKEKNIFERLMSNNDNDDYNDLEEECFDQDCEIHHPQKPMPIVKGKKTGRNEPCPCGSGKKFKKCCLNKELVLS